MKNPQRRSAPSPPPRFHGRTLQALPPAVLFAWVALTVLALCAPPALSGADGASRALSDSVGAFFEGAWDVLVAVADPAFWLRWSGVASVGQIS